MKRGVQIRVKGIVKGVFFRASVQDMAKRLGLKGFVRNTEDGVEVVAEGNNTELEQLVEFCRKGPKFSKVEGIEVKEGNYTGIFNDFKILSI